MSSFLAPDLHVRRAVAALAAVATDAAATMYTVYIQFCLFVLNLASFKTFKVKAEAVTVYAMLSVQIINSPIMSAQ